MTLPQALIGQTLGGYRLLRHVGSGGVAHVFAAEGPRGEVSAVKVLKPELLRRKNQVERLEREAFAALRISHPHVLSVRGPAAFDQGLRYFAMELLEGRDLADELARLPVLDPPRAVRLIRMAAEGLGAAHASGVVHRDVKPENLFLVRAGDPDESVKVVDFGIGWVQGGPPAASNQRITTRGGFVGTPEYVAPEQAHGAPGHPTADVYSLGVTLFELLSGKVPFCGKTWLETVELHGTAPLPHLPRISTPLWITLERALAKDPSERFADGFALVQALAEAPEASGGR